ncbi:MAG: hypothetical protein ACFFEF_02010 [Candidatus Thorarchaeota archaeon]
MNEVTMETAQTDTPSSQVRRFSLQNRNMILRTILFGAIGAVLYVGISLIPMPFTMVGILKFGLLPGVAIIAATGGIRGSLAGFIAGYFGVVLYGLVAYNVLVTMTLPAVAYGVLGLIAGLKRYDFESGRSLAKLSSLSVIGFLITGLLLFVIGITVEGYSMLAGIGFAILPLLTTGIPTILFLTPIFAKLYHVLKMRYMAPAKTD